MLDKISGSFWAIIRLKHRKSLKCSTMT